MKRAPIHGYSKWSASIRRIRSEIQGRCRAWLVIQRAATDPQRLHLFGEGQGVCPVDHRLALNKASLAE